MYELRYMPGAERYFKKVREKGLKQAYRKALGEIASDPYSGEAKVGDLAGVYCKDVYYNKTNYENRCCDPCGNKGKFLQRTQATYELINKKRLLMVTSAAVLR